MLRHVFSSLLGARVPAVTALLLLCTFGAVRATTVRAPAFASLVSEADLVVRARAMAVTAEQRSSVGNRKIVTRVEFEVLEPVLGSPPARLTLEFLGGRIGDEAMIVAGMPHFAAGAEDILFVQGHGRSVCPLVGMMHGRYAVERDPSTGRRYVTRDDGLPVRSLSDISAPHGEIALDETSRAAAIRTALTPEQFVELIKAARARSSRER